MRWIQDTVRDYLAGDRHAARNHNGYAGGPGQAPALDYLTAMERRTPEPFTGPLGMHRMDRTIPDDYFIASRNHPDRLFRGLTVAGTMPWGTHLGMVGGSWTVSFPDNHVLALAPPRSHAGKTSSLIVPAILSHPNPVVTASTKMDVLTATAMARAQYGELWCYAPAGDTEHIPDGVKELRWSPIKGARDWDVAVATATAMTAMMDSRGMKGGDHWKDRAADLLAAVFHWAALAEATMRDARDAVYGHLDELPRVGNALMDYGARNAASALLSVTDASHEEGRAIASTAARALKGYRTEAALRSTENATFDVADFVNGGSEYSVRADTVYITARSDEQELVAPLVVGLLTQIQREVYRRHRGLAAAGHDGGHGSAPVLFALDELYGLAPLPNLPHMLSEGASQGLLIVAAIQDLSLLKSRWPQEPGAFMTMFGHILVFPGIRDVTTLEAISKLHGSYDHEKREQSVKRHAAEGVSLFADYTGPWEDREESARIASERRPVLDIHQVMRGVKPGDPDELILFGPYGVGTVTATPYHRSAPWPMLLTAYLERALSGRVPEWRYWESTLSKEQPECEDTLARLPVPRLETWANAAMANPRAHPCDRAWAARYLSAVRERAIVLSRGPRRAQWDLGRTVPASEMWAVTHPAGRVPREVRHDSVTATRQEPPHETAAVPTGPADTAPIYVTPQGHSIDVTDEDIRLLASGASIPSAQDIADLWAGIPEATEFETGNWLTAERAVATSPGARSAEDNTAIAWAVERRSAFDAETSTWGRHRIEAEKIRRRMTGDVASITRYEEASAKVLAEAHLEGGTSASAREQAEKHRIGVEALRRGEPYPFHWWGALASAQRNLIEAFVLRRDLEADGAPQRDDDGRLSRFARVFDDLNAEASTRDGVRTAGPASPPAPNDDVEGAYGEGPARTAGADVSAPAGERPQARPGDHIQPVTPAPRSPDPEALPHEGPPTERPIPKPECWEPDWSPDEDRAMRRWVGTGDPMPDCFRSNFRHMMAAIEREKERRLQVGDAVSIDLYDRQARRLLTEGKEKRPEGQRLEEIVRANSLGFWAFLPPGMDALNKAFLEGENLAVSDGDDPIPPRATDVPKGVTEERWEELQKETERERAGRTSRWR